MLSVVVLSVVVLAPSVAGAVAPLVVVLVVLRDDSMRGAGATIVVRVSVRGAGTTTVVGADVDGATSRLMIVVDEGAIATSSGRFDKK